MLRIALLLFIPLLGSKIVTNRRLVNEDYKLRGMNSILFLKI